MSYRVFEQRKEDSSENMSDEMLAYFFTCFLSLLTHLLLYMLFSLFSSTAVARNILVIRVLFSVDRELVDTIGETVKCIGMLTPSN